MDGMSRRHLGAMVFAAGLAGATNGYAEQPGAGTMTAGSDAAPIDEGMFVDIKGMEQWITIRGRDRRNPVLLLLHGGPGFPMSFMAPALAAWEKDFTLVQWDQPGGGATYSKNIGRDQGPLTIARYVTDGLAVAEFVCAHLKTKKIVLMGISWGTMLGVMMVQRRPDLFAAWVGASQVVSGPEGGQLGYQLALKAARSRGDTAAIAALERVGPPPYATFENFLVRQTYSNPPGLPPSPAEAAAMAAQARILSVPPPADAHYIARGLPPYDFVKVFLATQRATFAETWTWQARDYGYAFKMPVFIFQGENDINAPIALARAYYEEVRAPKKGFETIAGAGHNTFAFPDQLLALLDNDVRPLVVRSAAPSLG
jgi:pimeloyl-ACP methyl ester carboxylesterase